MRYVTGLKRADPVLAHTPKQLYTGCDKGVSFLSRALYRLQSVPIHVGDVVLGRAFARNNTRLAVGVLARASASREVRVG